MNMHNSTKVVHSSAIRAEVKRHESLQSTFNKLLKHVERVDDQQLRTGLKVYIHGVQGKSTQCLEKLLSQKSQAKNLSRNQQSITEFDGTQSSKCRVFRIWVKSACLWLFFFFLDKGASAVSLQSYLFVLAID